MRKIIVLIGISGSGKTTKAAEYLKQNPNTLRVNRDDIRMQITASNQRMLKRDIENLVSKIQDEQIRTMLLSGYDVLIDNTHLKTKYLDEIYMKFGHMAKIYTSWINCTLEFAQNRVLKRDSITNVDYIERQHNDYLKLEKDVKDFKPSLKGMHPFAGMPHNNEIPNTIICDLDGTLSLYDEKKSAYDRDFENDTWNKAVGTVLESFLISHNFGENPDIIHFFSGRNAKHKDKTLEFLTKNGLIPDQEFKLVMRAEDDARRDSVVKMEMFEQNIPGKYNPLFVIDDRLQVIEECWNRLGLFVFNVNQTNKRF